MNRSTLMLGLALAMVGAAAACSDNASDSLRPRTGNVPASGTGSNGNDPNNPNGTGSSGGAVANEEALFTALDTEFVQKCGNACHKDQTFAPKPPGFLVGETTTDRYKTIKTWPGIVVADIYQSTILTKGAHAGPAISADPTFEKKIIDWLTAESLAITSVGLPSTDPVTVTQGPNELDLSKAATGITGVKLKFDASLVGGMLSLSNIKLVAPAGTDTHIVHPQFVRVAAAPVNNQTQIIDPQDSFSNVDQTTAGGSEAPLGPGSALFSGDGWRPFDLAKDKIRVQVSKLEKGTVQVTAPSATCKNVQMFQTNVLPALKGNGFTPNCSGCHGGGLAGMSLNSQDTATVCIQVMSKLNQANIGQSLIVTKVTAGPHNGGTVNDATGWRNLFVNNAAAFF